MVVVSFHPLEVHSAAKCFPSSKHIHPGHDALEVLVHLIPQAARIPRHGIQCTVRPECGWHWLLHSGVLPPQREREDRPQGLREGGRSSQWGRERECESAEWGHAHEARYLVTGYQQAGYGKSRWHSDKTSPLLDRSVLL